MAAAIKTLTIQGFKSIRSLEQFELRSLNVLIGANGAGKSNFVSFFRLLRAMIDRRLQLAVATTEGGADACLHLGPKTTKQFHAELRFAQNGYEFSLVPTPDNHFVFSEEAAVFLGDYANVREPLGSGHTESVLAAEKDAPGKGGARYGVPHHVFSSLTSWIVFHFHDTSVTAAVRRSGPINDNESLRPDAENLAALLFRVRRTHPECYRSIRNLVRLAAPFFDDFHLRVSPLTPDMIQLEWRQRDSDYPFRANQLSDGTLRFICLATALLQPNLPATALFDEPELGLHPYALTLLGNLFNQVADSKRTQIILSTQSALLISEFAPEDVIVVERVDGASTFRRLNAADLTEWLGDYSLGELWQKNVLGGRPNNRALSPVPNGVPG